jgi:tryptophan synthase alpha chain
LAECRIRGEGAFAPFFVLGDPSVELTLRWIDAVAAAGPDLFEFGFPFSDPPADGPVIQAADERALEAGSTPERCFEILAEARVRHCIPAAILVYANTVLQFGIDAFYARCAATGVDGVLVADLSLEESGPFVEAARDAGVAPVFVASRLSDESRLARIAELGEAYVYLVGRVGVTGERRELDGSLAGLVERVRGATGLPVLVGFGISTPEQVRRVVAAGADGAICGSAFVRRIAELGSRPGDCATELGGFAATMKEATRVQLPM